jgi:hypothetical protein
MGGPGAGGEPLRDLTVWTQDQGFDVLAEIAPDLRIHRG